MDPKFHGSREFEHFARVFWPFAGFSTPLSLWLPSREEKQHSHQCNPVWGRKRERIGLSTTPQRPAGIPLHLQKKAFFLANLLAKSMVDVLLRVQTWPKLLGKKSKLFSLYFWPQALTPTRNRPQKSIFPACFFIFFHFHVLHWFSPRSFAQSVPPDGSKLSQKKSTENFPWFLTYSAYWIPKAQD